VKSVENEGPNKNPPPIEAATLDYRQAKPALTRRQIFLLLLLIFAVIYAVLFVIAFQLNDRYEDIVPPRSVDVYLSVVSFPMLWLRIGQFENRFLPDLIVMGIFWDFAVVNAVIWGTTLAAAAMGISGLIRRTRRP
jgi:hypothetical protein